MRIQSMLLVMIMLLTPCIPRTMVSAEETSGDFCIHHPAHTDTCGYGEAIEGMPCAHVHDEACGYRETTEEIPCDLGCSDVDGDGIVDHGEGCAYRPASEGSPCAHVHDETCGYVEGQESSPCLFAVEGCPYCVVSWQWVDNQGALVNMDGVWGMGLPGVSEDAPLTRQLLMELLPSQITATSDNGTECLLDLTWDLSALPETGTTQGDYTVTAALADPQYALATSAPALTVLVQVGGAQVLQLTLPTGSAASAPFEDLLVNGLSPNGTTINLFDYWITNRTDSDKSNGDNFINQGINKDHALLFGNGLRDYGGGTGSSLFGDWNVWTESESPRASIVQGQLGTDGYPVLNGLNVAGTGQLTGRNGSESLAYLFNPVSGEGKMSFRDVQGLLQVNDDGYYYYNSQENYAVYYPDSNSFALYKYPGVKAGGSSPAGQFFPFNMATETGDSFINPYTSSDTSINHYFGMHMSTRFIQQNGGYTDRNRNTPVTYAFSGDDDVWIFIDGVLVADLGGIHNAASVEINFATGEIKINAQTQPERLGGLLGYGTNILPDDTYHTLDFFYLERGNVDSNMNLKYNLVTIPESSLIKIDQLGDPVPGAQFTLFPADDTDFSNPIATGTTDSNGEFVFLRTDASGNSYPITITELYDTYGNVEAGGNNLLLKETVTPAGYRSVGEIGLSFYKTAGGEVLLLSNSVWDKGAYAMAKVTATTGNTISLLETATGTAVNQTVALVGNNAVPNPLMFAVVFQKQTDGTWLPVSGDPLSGWTVHGDSTWESVLAAATANPYIFQLASSGAYQVEIENLPGDIKAYYHVCNDENAAKYTVAYYYTEAGTLGEAAADNTWRIAAGQDSENPLTRMFSMNLYVTNIKNRLLVQKVDETGATVNGATFALYKAEDVTLENGKAIINSGASPYDSLTTEDVTGILNLPGGGIFPTQGKVLEKGEYYLLETAQPAGYVLNETPVHIVVDDTGVYADAGTQTDGVAVLRGVGSVMRSMVQFAVDDRVDTTLNGIKAALAANVTYINGSFTWDAPVWDGDGSAVLHLQYANANKMLDYGLYEEGVGSLDSLTLATDAGWSKLLIQQCYQHDSAVDTSLKTNLEGQDLTNLFSGTVTVRVTNEKEIVRRDVTIEKIITGNLGDLTKTFSFTVVSSQAMQAGEGYALTPDGKTATFSLGHNAQVVLKGVPVGAVLTIQEDASGYEQTITIGGTEIEDGAYTVTDGENQLITVTNRKDVVIDTGIMLDTLPHVLVLLTAGVLGIPCVLGRRRRQER